MYFLLRHRKIFSVQMIITSFANLVSISWLKFKTTSGRSSYIFGTFIWEGHTEKGITTLSSVTNKNGTWSPVSDYFRVGISRCFRVRNTVATLSFVGLMLQCSSVLHKEIISELLYQKSVWTFGVHRFFKCHLRWTLVLVKWTTKEHCWHY